jgi:phenylacetate-CoA ligase
MSEEKLYIRSDGGATVEDIKHLKETGPDDIAKLTRNQSVTSGGVLMSSGGTTGEPKLTWVPHTMAMDRITKHWKPINSHSVLLNLFNPGRLWGSHYYMQELARHVGAVSLPSGPILEDSINWWSIFQIANVDTLAGNPTVLKNFAIQVLKAEIELNIKTIIWMAEPMTAYIDSLLKRAFPKAKLWGNYGSVDAWVMGVSWPECDRGTLHLLDEQLMECSKEGSLLTRTGDGWTVKTERYNTGDVITPIKCSCGKPHAFKVLGRAGDVVSLCSAIFSINELDSIILKDESVLNTQYVISNNGSEKDAGTDNLTVNLLLKSNTNKDIVCQRIRQKLINGLVHMGAVVSKYDHALSVNSVEQLSFIERTGKTPKLLKVNKNETTH